MKNNKRKKVVFFRESFIDFEELVKKSHFENEEKISIKKLEKYLIDNHKFTSEKSMVNFVIKKLKEIS